MINLVRGLTAALTLVLAALGLAGCSPSAPGQCPGMPAITTSARPLMLVIGAHAGSPAPGVPAVVTPPLDAAILSEKPIWVVRLDGQPEVVTLPATKMTSVSCEAMQRRYNEATAIVFGTVQGLAPKVAGADPWSAINLAVSAARTMDGAKVIVIDSLLSDTGPINSSTGGITTADPDAVAAYVNKVQKVDMAGVEIELVGAGETAAPQQPLSPAEKTTLASVWGSTLAKAGARVTITPTPRPAVGPSTSLSVKPTPVASIVPFTAPVAGSTTTTRYPDSGPLHFATNSDHVADREAAQAALAPVAEWLAGNPGRHIDVHGRTDSSGTAAHNLDLASRRAQTVASLLQALQPGIGASQISIYGDATNFPGFVPDRLPDGSLGPAAADNRSVVLVATTTTE